MTPMKLVLACLAATTFAFGQVQNADKVPLKTLEKEYLTAKAALAKKPKDKKLQEKFVFAGVRFGHQTMMAPDLSAKIKYKAALKVYREVLKIDPNNDVAKPESEMIVQIYKSMGRPVPQ